jgi:hypothetical protein
MKLVLILAIGTIFSPDRTNIVPLNQQRRRPILPRDVEAEHCIENSLSRDCSIFPSKYFQS